MQDVCDFVPCNLEHADFETIAYHRRSGVLSRLQSKMSGSLLGVATEGGETSSSAGEMEVTLPLRRVLVAVPKPEDCPAGLGSPLDPPLCMADVERSKPASSLPRHLEAWAAALPQLHPVLLPYPQPHDLVILLYLTHLKPIELISGQQEGPDLASFIC